MTAFDHGWWDAKTLSLDVVDTTGDPMTPRLNWIRWRLIDELLRRYYQDIGLEVGFGPLGMELYNDPVWSPNCKRAPRYFGRLCANHAHSAMDDEWPDLAPTFSGGRRDYLQEGTWGSWTEYLYDAIHVMGLDAAGVPGHEGCWHRRAKATLPLVFRVALLLRTSQELSWELSRHGMYSYPCHPKFPDPCGRDEIDGLDVIFSLLESRGELVGSVPRGLVVRSAGEPWIAIRSDGLVITRHGDASLREMWQTGDDEVAIARRIKTLARWRESGQEPAQKDDLRLPPRPSPL